MVLVAVDGPFIKDFSFTRGGNEELHSGILEADYVRQSIALEYRNLRIDIGVVKSMLWFQSTYAKRAVACVASVVIY